MRQLNTLELNAIAGGENHQVAVIDPVLLYAVASNADRQGFDQASKVLGMGAGLIVGAKAGALCLSEYALVGGIFGGLGGMFAGAVLGRAFSITCTTVFDAV
jgi:hypothetical protein